MNFWTDLPANSSLPLLSDYSKITLRIWIESFLTSKPQKLLRVWRQVWCHRRDWYLPAGAQRAWGKRPGRDWQDVWAHGWQSLGSALLVSCGLGRTTFLIRERRKSWLTLKGLTAIRVKLLIAISRVYQLVRPWELRTWLLKLNSTNISTASPHYFCKKCMETQKENL